VGDRESTNLARKKIRSRKPKANITTLELVIGVVLLVAVIFLSGFARLIYDMEFYRNEFERNDVRVSNRIELTQELFNYFQDKGDIDNFNDKERLHLIDVKNLIKRGFTILYSLLIATAVYFVYIYRKGRTKENLDKLFLRTAGAIIIFSILSFVLVGFFQKGFIWFHLLFFDNDLWMLNPATDMLIVLFPQEFFFHFVVAAYVFALRIALLMIVIVMITRALGSRLKKSPAR